MARRSMRLKEVMMSVNTSTSPPSRFKIRIKLKQGIGSVEQACHFPAKTMMSSPLPVCRSDGNTSPRPSGVLSPRGRDIDTPLVRFYRSFFPAAPFLPGELCCCLATMRFSCSFGASPQRPLVSQFSSGYAPAYEIIFRYL
ncbi:hypothetical protein J6590_001943 [Homalodisca vitripennis]|nr:hypothetical protein J6590_001943 [Homalodisca vitripennis]